METPFPRCGPPEGVQRTEMGKLSRRDSMGNEEEGESTRFESREEAQRRAELEMPFTRACFLGHGEVVKVFLRFFEETVELPLGHDTGEDEYSSVPPSDLVSDSLASSNPYSAPIKERPPK
ncbi:unnamed protein product, partial [Amoebophrya sp. A25]|eukprot:GSA25T00006221001.1